MCGAHGGGVSAFCCGGWGRDSGRRFFSDSPAANAEFVLTSGKNHAIIYLPAKKRLLVCRPEPKNGMGELATEFRTAHLILRSWEKADAESRYEFAKSGLLVWSAATGKPLKIGNQTKTHSKK